MRQLEGRDAPPAARFQLAASVLGVLRLTGAAELRNADVSPHVGPRDVRAAERVEVETDVIADEDRALLAAGRVRTRPEPHRVVRIGERGRDGLVGPAGAVIRRRGEVDEVLARALGALLLIDDTDLAASGGDPREPLV